MPTTAIEALHELIIEWMANCEHRGEPLPEAHHPDPCGGCARATRICKAGFRGGEVRFQDCVQCIAAQIEAEENADHETEDLQPEPDAPAQAHPHPRTAAEADAAEAAAGPEAARVEIPGTRLVVNEP